MRSALLAMLSLLFFAAAGAPGPDPATLEPVLNRVRELVRGHRYGEVVDLLEPFHGAATLADDDEAQYAVAVELGRARFNLADYGRAFQLFGEAVKLHPERVESALYLEASSYLTGHREQAFAIFRELVRSGAPDLYLAVTLPGERAFLGEPEVWKILDELGPPLEVDLRRGTLKGVQLGEARAAVERTFGAGGAGGGSVLAARAGPKLIWALRFAGDALAGFTVQVENVSCYTPFRIRFDRRMDWRLTPQQARFLLGKPDRSDQQQDGTLELVWQRKHHRVRLLFGPPTTPRPELIGPDSQVLQMVEIDRSGR